MDVSKLSREDWLVLGTGVLLIIGLFAFPWYSVSGITVDGISVGGTSPAATSSPYSIWGILAVIVTIAIVADFALARFSPQTHLPTTQFGRDQTRVGAAGLLVLLLFIKFVAHVGNFGWGFFFDVIFAAALTFGVWAIAQGRSTPIERRSTTTP